MYGIIKKVTHVIVPWSIVSEHNRASKLNSIETLKKSLTSATAIDMVLKLPILKLFNLARTFLGVCAGLSEKWGGLVSDLKIHWKLNELYIVQVIKHKK